MLKKPSFIFSQFIPAVTVKLQSKRDQGMDKVPIRLWFYCTSRYGLAVNNTQLLLKIQIRAFAKKKLFISSSGQE